MYLQVLKIHRHFPIHSHLLWIEHGQTVSSTKDERSVFKPAGSPVVELVSTDTVISEPVGKIFGRPVIQSKSILRTDPKISGLILFYGCDIKTRSAGNMNQFHRLKIEAEQSVCQGSDPYHSIRCLMHTRRHEHRPLDTVPPHIRIYRKLTDMILTTVNQREPLVKGSRQDRTIIQRKTVRSKCKWSGNCLDRMHGIIFRRNISHGLTHRSHPYTSIFILRYCH